MEKVISFCKRKETILVPCGILVATFVASILISWSIGLRTVNSSLDTHLEIGKAAQENITKAVQALATKILNEQEQMEIKLKAQESSISNIGKKSTENSKDVENLRTNTDAIERNLTRLGENTTRKDNAHDMVIEVLSKQADLFSAKMQVLENVTRQQSDKLTSINETVSFMDLAFQARSQLMDNHTEAVTNNMTKLRSDMDYTMAVMKNFTEQFNLSQTTYETLKNDYEKLQLAVNLISKTSNSTDLSNVVEPLKESLTKIYAEQLTQKISMVEKGFKEAILKKKDSMDWVKRQFKEVYTLLVEQNGYVEIGDFGYYKLLTHFTWEQAKTKCNSFGGILVEFVNLDQMNAVYNYFDENNGIDSFWIGGSDELVEGKFVWDSNKSSITANFSAWAEGEPNDAHSVGEDCVEIRQKQWNDLPCFDERRAVCQLRVDFIPF